MMLRTLVTLALLLLPALAHAQGAGLWVAGATGRPTCASITNPVAGLTWCFDGSVPSAPVLKVWNGSAYVGGQGVPSINGLASAVTILGTANEIGVVTAPGSITISAAQPISTVSSPTFAGLTLTGNLSVAGTVAFPGIAPGSTECAQITNTGLLVPSGSACGGGGGGVSALNALAGALSLVGTANRVTVSSVGTTITLSGPQDLATTSSPTFATLTGTALVGTASVTGPTVDKGGQWYNARGYGVATGNSGAANAAALNTLANTTMATTKGVLYIPPGDYTIGPGWVVGLSDIHVLCAGPNATTLHFDPTLDGQALVTFTTGTSALLARASFEGCGITSSNTTLKKYALDLAYTTEFVLLDTVVGPDGGWTGNNSACLRWRGKDHPTISRHAWSCDTPISIEQSSRHGSDGIDIDHAHASDLYLTANGQPVVNVATGVNLTNVTFDGRQSWNRGTSGFFWHDTTSALVGQNLVLNNIRWEQAESATGYAVDVAHNFTLDNLRVVNLYTVNRLAKLRKVRNVVFANHRYDGTGAAYDFDATVDNVTIQSLGSLSGASITATGLTRVFATPLTTGGSTIPEGLAHYARPLAPFLFGVDVQGTRLGLGIAPDTQFTLTGQQHFRTAAATLYAQPATNVTTTLDLVAANTGTPQYNGNGAAIRLQGTATGADGTILFSTNQAGVGSGERARITAAGSFGIGTATPAALLDVRGAGIVSTNLDALPSPFSSSVLQLVAASATGTYATLDGFGADAGVVVRRSGGTPTARSALGADVSIGFYGGAGTYDATSYSPIQASLGLFTAQAWSAGNFGTYLTVGYTPVGSTTLTEALRIGALPGVSGTQQTLLKMAKTVTGDLTSVTLNVTAGDGSGSPGPAGVSFPLYVTGQLKDFTTTPGASSTVSPVVDAVRNLVTLGGFSSAAGTVGRITYNEYTGTFGAQHAEHYGDAVLGVINPSSATCTGGCAFANHASQQFIQATTNAVVSAYTAQTVNVATPGTGGVYGMIVTNGVDNATNNLVTATAGAYFVTRKGSGAGVQTFTNMVQFRDEVTGTNNLLMGADGTIQTAAGVLPLTDTGGQVGTASFRWGSIYGVTVRGDNLQGAGGAAGLSVTKTVRAAGGAADCTLIFTSGLLTGGSC